MEPSERETPREYGSGGHLACSVCVERLARTVRASDHPMLASIDELESLTEIRGDATIEANPPLPSCAGDALLTLLGKTCMCSGNDDAATCE